MNISRLGNKRCEPSLSAFELSRCFERTGAFATYKARQPKPVHDKRLSNHFVFFERRPSRGLNPRAVFPRAVPISVTQGRREELAMLSCREMIRKLEIDGRQGASPKREASPGNPEKPQKLPRSMSHTRRRHVFDWCLC